MTNACFKLSIRAFFKASVHNKHFHCTLLLHKLALVQSTNYLDSEFSKCEVHLSKSTFSRQEENRAPSFIG